MLTWMISIAVVGAAISLVALIYALVNEPSTIADVERVLKSETGTANTVEKIDGAPPQFTGSSGSTVRRSHAV